MPPDGALWLGLLKALRVLRERIRDIKPRCLGLHEDVSTRALVRIAIDGAHRYADEAWNQWVERERGAAASTEHVVEGLGLRDLEPTEKLFTSGVGEGAFWDEQR
jgi:hypothetical protein